MRKMKWMDENLFSGRVEEKMLTVAQMNRLSRSCYILSHWEIHLVWVMAKNPTEIVDGRFPVLSNSCPSLKLSFPSANHRNVETIELVLIHQYTMRNVMLYSYNNKEKDVQVNRREKGKEKTNQ